MESVIAEKEKWYFKRNLGKDLKKTNAEQRIKLALCV